MHYEPNDYVVLGHIDDGIQAIIANMAQNHMRKVNQIFGIANCRDQIVMMYYVPHTMFRCFGRRGLGCKWGQRLCSSHGQIPLCPSRTHP
jgi:hypothetical protein